MKLDTTKVYYLGDLSDEQLDALLNRLGFKTWSKGKKTFLYSVDNKWCISDLMFDIVDSVINALTLFKNERIAQIQLRIQELNNELIELDEEMRKLTYEN